MSTLPPPLIVLMPLLTSESPPATRNLVPPLTMAPPLLSIVLAVARAVCGASRMMFMPSSATVCRPVIPAPKMVCGAETKVCGAAWKKLVPLARAELAEVTKVAGAARMKPVPVATAELAELAKLVGAVRMEFTPDTTAPLVVLE